MQTEIEVKFYPIDKDKVRARLKELGAELITPEAIFKIVFFGNTSNPGLKNIHYIRVRDEINKVTLTAKLNAREGETINDAKETEVEVSSFDATVNILQLAGLINDYDQEKYREVWEYKDCEIVIDTYPELKPLIEVEGPSEDILKEVSNKLGFNWDDGIFTSITEIYQKELGFKDFDEALKYTMKLKF